MLLALCLLTQSSLAAMTRAGPLAHLHRHATSGPIHMQGHGHDHGGNDDHEHDHAHDHGHAATADHWHDPADDSVVRVESGSDPAAAAERALKRLTADAQIPVRAAEPAVEAPSAATRPALPVAFRSHDPSPPERPPRRSTRVAS
jgi:hypothetical protein